jgi:hypothetical protein
MAYSNVYAKFYGLSQKTGAVLAGIWRFRPNQVYLLLETVLQIVAWCQASFIFRNLTGSNLVLHYNVDFGIDNFGDPVQIFWYPVYGLGIFILNFVIAAALQRHQDWRIFDHLLFTAAVLFGLFLNLALLFIYLINFK